MRLFRYFCFFLFYQKYFRYLILCYKWLIKFLPAPPTLQNFFRLIYSLTWFTRSFWMFYSIWFYVNDVWDFYSFWLLSNYFWSFNQFFGFGFQKWFIVFFSIISIRDFFINLVGSNNKSFFFWCFIEQLLFSLVNPMRLL